jgi:glycosyltransferase involved in cell wall biosynthesis
MEEIKPFISIIIPTYNRLKYAKETIDSVLAQSNKNYECIIVDDGSNEEEFLELNSLCEGIINLIFVRRPEDFPKGANSCRNYGASLSKSNYLFFLDSDDIIDKTFVENRIKDISGYPKYDLLIYPVNVFYNTPGDSKLIWNKLKTDQNPLDRFLNFDNPWHTSSVLWKKSFFSKIDGFDEKCLSWQDWDIHLRAILNKPTFHEFEYGVDVYYRQHKEVSISKESMNREKFINRVYVFDKILDLVKENEELSLKRGYYFAKLFINLILNFKQKNKKDLSKIETIIFSQHLITKYDWYLWRYRVESKNIFINKIIDKYIYLKFKEHFLDTKTTYLNTFLAE